MGIGEFLKGVHFGTPVYRVILKMKVKKELFQVNPFGYGMDNLERYGVASRIARNLVEAPVWHYTDKGNLVCGGGRNTDTLLITEFTIVIDDNLEFLNRMCPCESRRVAVRKFFAIGATIAGPNPGEKPHTSFHVILGDIRG